MICVIFSKLADLSVPLLKSCVILGKLPNYSRVPLLIHVNIGLSFLTAVLLPLSCVILSKLPDLFVLLLLSCVILGNLRDLSVLPLLS